MTVSAATKVASLLFVWSFAQVSLAQVAAFPAAPKSGETVRLQILDGGLSPGSSDIWDFRAHRVSMSGTRITVGIVTRGMGFSPPEPSPRIDLPLGQFPEGSYIVDVQVESPDRTPIRTVGSVSFSVSPKASGDPLWNLTDLWWNSSESGWGFNVIQHPSGVMFATWFVYGADGRATWYVVPDARPISLGAGFRGQVYRTTGPAFCADTASMCPGPQFNPAAVNATLVGQASFDFSPTDYDQAFFRITIDGKTVEKTVRRQSF